LVDCGVLATRPQPLVVLHTHEVDVALLAGVVRRIHEAEHRLYPGAVRRFPGEPWRREGRRLVLAGRRVEVPRD
jgi:hypothetical protein